MNEILQKRIEEAAKKICCTDCPMESIRNCKGCVDRENAIKTGIFALQNQWISVDEGLPEDFEKVFFRAVGKNDAVCFGTGYVVKEDWYTDIQCGEQDYFKFEITHWMPIPELKGGEK